MKLVPQGKAETLARDLFEHTRSVSNVQMFIQEVQAAMDVEVAECLGHAVGTRGPSENG